MARVVQLTGAVEVEDVSEHLWVSVEEVLLGVLVEEELLLRGAQQGIWVAVQSVLPCLQRQNTAEPHSPTVFHREQSVNLSREGSGAQPASTWRYLESLPADVDEQDLVRAGGLVHRGPGHGLSGQRQPAHGRRPGKGQPRRHAGRHLGSDVGPAGLES